MTYSKQYALRALACAFLVTVFAQPALASPKRCVTPEAASKYLNKDICVSAHVYDVVELSDGTRFLDLCSTTTSDEACRFSIVSMNADRKEVGDLNPYREQEINIRGIVRPFNSRTEIVLSREQQFHGGSEKFHPNPALLKGFSAAEHKPAFRDRASASNPHWSTFSNRQ